MDEIIEGFTVVENSKHSISLNISAEGYRWERGGDLILRVLLLNSLACDWTSCTVRGSEGPQELNNFEPGFLLLPLCGRP